MVFDFFARGSHSLHKGEFDLSTRHEDQLFQGHHYLYLLLPSEFKASLGLHVIFFQEKKKFLLLFFLLAHIYLLSGHGWYISSSSNPGS